jgi:2'-hydroxyisoflavone reductase
MTEHAPARLLPLNAEQDYGSNKAYCEKVVSDIFGARALIIRPGLIVGPHDPTDRFTYWPCRISRGGRVLAPGREDRRIQFIDVRDLSEWIIRLVEAKISGTFSATGPGFVYTMKLLLHECQQLTNVESQLVWVSDETLLESGVTPWTEMPMWIPDSDTEFRGFMQVDCNKAQNTGLSYRTPSETISTILAWDADRKDPNYVPKAGMDPSKETEILSKLLGF